MKNLTSFSTIILLPILLLQFCALRCSARSTPRSNPPGFGTNLVLSNFNDPNASLTAGPADPRLKILSKVPHDEKIGGLTLRITALKGGPFISSFKLLPCVVDALSTAFNSVWNEIDQHQPLQDDEYMCSHHALTLILRSNKKPLKGMEYSDLVTLARLLLSFQQVYMLPGISFDYLEDGVKTGSGDIDWNQAESSLQGLEQA